MKIELGISNRSLNDRNTTDNQYILSFKTDLQNFIMIFRLILN